MLESQITYIAVPEIKMSCLEQYDTLPILALGAELATKKVDLPSIVITKALELGGYRYYTLLIS